MYLESIFGKNNKRTLKYILKRLNEEYSLNIKFDVVLENPIILEIYDFKKNELIKKHSVINENIAFEYEKLCLITEAMKIFLSEYTNTRRIKKKKVIKKNISNIYTDDNQHQ